MSELWSWDEWLVGEAERIKHEQSEDIPWIQNLKQSEVMASKPQVEGRRLRKGGGALDPFPWLSAVIHCQSCVLGGWPGSAPRGLRRTCCLTCKFLWHY